MSLENSTNREQAEPEVNKLTPREEEVLALYLKSGRLETVANALGLSMHAVRRHKEHVTRKLCLKNAVELAFSAVNNRERVTNRGESK